MGTNFSFELLVQLLFALAAKLCFNSALSAYASDARGHGDARIAKEGTYGLRGGKTMLPNRQNYG
jgi:hypothetical protein